MKIGIFGGTFDPPHIGHLIAAQDALETLGLDRVIFVPARIPPHKQHENVTAAALRLKMLHAAVTGDERFEVSDMELRREGPSYTIDTLRQMRSERAGDELFLLVGVDQVAEFATWREPEQVLQHARLVMLTRAGIAEAAATDNVHVTVPVTRVDISSTLVRDRAAAGLSVRHMVPEAVDRIIAAEGLYSRGTG